MKRILSALGLVLLLLPGRGDAVDDAYAAGIAAWQQQHEKDVRTGGWLLLVGRYAVPEGSSSVGSDPAATIVLPEGAPQRLGVLRRSGEILQFEHSPGVAVTLDGAPGDGIAELATGRGKGRVAAGRFSFVVRRIGEDYYALVQDSENPAARRFKGTEWFPIDAGYRVQAEFVAYRQPQRVPVPMTHLDSRELMDSSGEVVFRLHGAQFHLRSFVDGDELFIMFRDTTNGRDTYGGGRFLHAPLPKNGVTTLDFNKAFNPFCAVNDYVVCPVVPAENRVAASVPAGQQYHGSESH